MPTAPCTNLPTISVANARLPDNYIAAKAALAACAKTFTPEGYARCGLALRACWEADECATWPDDHALASYARISEDDELERLARRVEKRRREWRAAVDAAVAG